MLACGWRGLVHPWLPDHEDEGEPQVALPRPDCQRGCARSPQQPHVAKHDNDEDRGVAQMGDQLAKIQYENTAGA